MPYKQAWYLNALREEYLNALMNRKELPHHTITEYRRLIRHATAGWETAGLRSSPKKVGAEEIDYLRHELYSHLQPTVNRRQISIIGQYLKFHGNNIVEKLMIPWPPNNRPHAKWLTDEEGVRLIDAAKTPLQKMLIHLELRLLMRRVEVIRLTTSNVQVGLLHVRGKGRLGGKWRTLAWAPDTLLVVEEYTRYREETIANALEIEPNQRIPDNIMIYARFGWKLAAYQESSLDKMVKEVAVQARIPQEDVSNHVLRRTGTRIHRHAGVGLEELSAALGHSSPKQTLDYAGLNVDELSQAQVKVKSYIDEMRTRMAQEPYRAMPIYRPQLIKR